MNYDRGNYPFSNLSLKSMKGEIWKDVPGFDGAYLISNLGRVKSLRRWRNAGPASGYYTKERILKTRIAKSSNNHLGIKTYSLGISLKLDGKIRSVSIARLVYSVFVKHFDIDDPGLIISYKDFEGKNLRPDNLVLTTRSELRKRMYRLNRSLSHWQKNKLPVRQLDMKGKIVTEYDSLTDASQKTGFNLGAIAECAKGNIFQHKGYKWQLITKSPPPAPKKNEQIFNHSLWLKIDRIRTSKKNPIPALNLSLNNLEGESWKPIEGLTGSYQISSFGRVKSLGRFKENKIWLKEHILRLVTDGSQHRPAGTLLVSLSKNGLKYQCSIARLVYYHFIKKFDLKNKSVRIRYKDGRFYNLHYKNLILK